MKNNMFQTVLMSFFIAGSLLTMVSISAGQIDRDWLPSGFVDSAQFAFDTIMNRPWHKAFGVRVRDNWGYWSVNQQAQIIQRMAEQGLISPSQAEESNWIDLEEGPAITTGG